VKQRALAWLPEPMRFAASLETVPAADSDELPPWEEDSESDTAQQASDSKPESGGDDAGSDGIEPSEVEEAA
jgi:hypothetical protein